MTTEALNPPSEPTTDTTPETPAASDAVVRNTSPSTADSVLSEALEENEPADPIMSASPTISSDPADEASPTPQQEPSNVQPPDRDHDDNDVEDRKDNETDATAESAGDEVAKPGVGVKGRASSVPIVSTSKKNRPPYKYDPSKITLRFLFANRDGLTVTIECDPSDTVGEIKSSLLSVWPRDLPAYRDHDSVRFVCMGRGYLQPDSKTLEECQIPTFKTHPTPVNVSLRPDQKSPDDLKKKGHHDSTAVGNRTASIPPNATAVSQGCSCAIL